VSATTAMARASGSGRALSLGAILVVLAVAHPGQAAASAAPPPGQLALGVYLPGVPRDLWKLDGFARVTGRSPAIVHYFQPWGLRWNRFDVAANNAIRRRGAVPLVSWDPWAERLDDRRFALRTILSGKHDRYIRAWAGAAATWGHRLYIRFAAEMNGYWEPWSRWHNGNTSRQYVRAWHHVVRLFRKEGATNVRWVWSPNQVAPGETPLERLYPGDAWVDWVGFSAYNWGSSRGFESWEPMVELYRPTVEALREVTGSKPIMVTETGSDSQGGSKAEWIRTGFQSLPLELPDIRALVWFNRSAETSSGRPVNWLVEETMCTLAAYRQVVGQQTYQAKLP
jgi:mannan endo-1,4-beta-mannosidase